MKVSESDPRSIRSRELLRNAMIKLVAEKHFASLTVQDVTREAGLNRTTFYLHYTGLHELLEDCARSMFGLMRAEIYAKPIPYAARDTTVLAPFVECVLYHMEKHEPFYRAMLGRQGDPLFRVLFQEQLSELIFEPIAERRLKAGPDPRMEMAIRFFSAGFTGIAAWWLEKGRPIPAEEAALQITRDILPGYLRLIGN